MEKTEKLSFGEWLENLWYRYKWLIIIVGLLIVFTVIALVQMLSNPTPDVSILYVGPQYFTQANREKLTETMKTLAPDYDGNGEINTDILDISLRRTYDVSDPEDYMVYDYNNDALKRFETEIRVGDAVIYILDRTYFDQCVELGILTPLSQALKDTPVPEDNLDGYGLLIGSIGAKELPGFKDVVPTDMVICLRRLPEGNEINYGAEPDFWENNRQAFENIVKYAG